MMFSSFIIAISICLASAIGIILIYLVIPNCIGRRPPRQVTIAPTRHQTYLTFDDGPSKITHELLDVLQAHQQQALFFVVGSRAANHPEIIARMVRDGHAVGVHAYDHKIHLLPHRTWADLSRCYRTLVELGVHPTYLRPPHGFYTLTTLLFCKTHQLTAFHWHALLGDWNLISSQELLLRLKQRTRPQAVLVLHDATSGSAHPQAKEIIPVVVDAYLSTATLDAYSATDPATPDGAGQ